MPIPTRSAAHQLLDTWIKNPALKHHCQMVAWAMEAYAQKLGTDAELWYQAGLLHDLDWEAFPDEHPNKAVAEWLGEYPEEMKHAILAHAPERTKTAAESQLDKYLFACDEISGFIHAVSLMRPTGLTDMAAKSVVKKLKDKSFASNVCRDDITHGADLIETPLADHITFLIGVFASK